MKSILKKIPLKQKIFILILVVAFIGGLVLSLFIFNQKQRSVENHFEVTFLDPHQAIVFWTTENETIGFVKYGKDASNLNQKAEQTSDTPGNIHAVLLTEIPIEGFYLSLHTQHDSPFLWPEIRKVNFDPSKIN